MTDGSSVAVIPATTNKVSFKADIEAWTPQLAPYCRHGFTPERLIVGALQAAVNTPDLFACQPASIFLALVKCARLGLDIGESGMWLVPIDSKGVKRCEAWIDYRAYKVLGKRSRMIRSMEEFVVYAGDEFDYALGLQPYLRHKPTTDPAKRGAILGAYAIIHRPHQPPSFHYLPIADIEARRAKSRGWSDKALAKKGEPTGPIAWWSMKAVCRDWFSRQPKTGDMALALESDDETPPHDPETGELLPGVEEPAA
ncbi:MAG: recombinase RecT [Gemmatimonadales bacterium]|nr:recombinase RecT [Gemmatimonadales bacterium]